MSRDTACRLGALKLCAFSHERMRRGAPSLATLANSREQRRTFRVPQLLLGLYSVALGVLLFAGSIRRGDVC